MDLYWPTNVDSDISFINDSYSNSAKLLRLTISVSVGLLTCSIKNTQSGLLSK